MKKAIALFVMCCALSTMALGYYSHLEYVELTSPRPIFKCTRVTHIEDGKVIKTWLTNCKRNPRSVIF